MARELGSPLRHAAALTCVNERDPRLRIACAMSARRPVPRYTSYPPANCFRDGFDESDLRAAIAASNEDPIPRRLSLYVHVPFCTSPCFFCACNRIITRDRSRGDAYVARLDREIDLAARCFDRDREVVQLHFGGGTPNFLPPALIGDIVDSLRAQFRFSAAADRDQSIEIDPRAASAGEMARLAAMDFNRVSFGIQDFDPQVQRAINRIQSVASCQALVAACRTAGFRSVGMDLILGLPKQSEASVARTIEHVLSMRPDRLALYEYAHLPDRFPAQRQIARAGLPTAAVVRAMRRLAEDRLLGTGYVPIGFDHFALPGDDLALALARRDLHRNFMGYTTHADCDLIGFGVSAISHVGDCYSQNPRRLVDWELAVDAGRLPACRGWTLHADDRLRADLIRQLTCEGAVDIRALEWHHDIDFADYFADELQALGRFATHGRLSVTSERIVVNSRNRDLLRKIALCFDPYSRKPGRSPTTATSSASAPPARSRRPASPKAWTRAT